MRRENPGQLGQVAFGPQAELGGIPAGWAQYSWAYLNLIGQDVAPIAFPTAPAVTFATPGDLAVTYTTQTGYYRRWGLLCQVTIEIETATFTHTTAAGNMRVTNLPFTAKMTGGFGSVIWQGITKANYTQMVAHVVVDDTFLRIQASGSAQNLDNIGAADVPTGGNVILRISMLYDV